MTSEDDVGQKAPTQKIWWEEGPAETFFEKAVDLLPNGRIIGQPYYTGWYRVFEIVEGKRLPAEYNFSTQESRRIGEKT